MVAHQESTPESARITHLLRRTRPAVGKRWLIMLAGIVWSGVGVRLVSLAYGWLKPLGLREAALLASLGVMLALTIYRFGFSRLADRNVTRINLYPGRVCLFAFQQWTSYLIVVVMMSLGIMMRRSPFPKPYLASMYTGIGGALFLASWHYYGHLLGRVGIRARAVR